MEVFESEMMMPTEKEEKKCREGGNCETDWNTGFKWCFKCDENVNEQYESKRRKRND